MIPGSLNTESILAVKFLVAAHQVDKSLSIMKNRPSPVPGVSLGVRAAPIHRVEGFYPIALSIPGTHKARLRVEKVFVVIHLPRKNIFVKLIAGCLGQLVGAKSS
jgi:hypothetical protein